MRFTTSRPGRAGAAELVAAVRRWTPVTFPEQLHPGDLGWELRFEDEHLDSTLLAVRDGRGALVAVGLFDDPVTLRIAIDPRRAQAEDLAVAVADTAEQVLPAGEVLVDGLPTARWRQVLADRGWGVDPHAWVTLYRPLAEVVPTLPERVAPVGDERDVTDRVAVQRAAFAGSTFTAERWARMAGCPPYDRRLDLLVRDADGTAVAAGTAWSAGRGRCALLEPVGTHHDHRGQGHGTRLLHGLCAALAALGASAVAVTTPATNDGAVRAYRGAGLTEVARISAMRRPG